MSQAGGKSRAKPPDKNLGPLASYQNLTLSDIAILSSASAQKTLVKVFTECDSRQRGLSEIYIDNDFFAKNFCRALDKVFCECHLVLGKEKSPSQHYVMVTEPLPSDLSDTRQTSPLRQVPASLTLDKEGSSGPFCESLCRVPVVLSLGKEGSSGPFCQSLF